VLWFALKGVGLRLFVLSRLPVALLESLLIGNKAIDVGEVPHYGLAW
jgi:hypothetical protein